MIAVSERGESTTPLLVGCVPSLLTAGPRGSKQGQRESNSGVQLRWCGLHFFWLVVQGRRDFPWVKCTPRKDVHGSHLASVPPKRSPSPCGPQLHVTVGCLLGSQVEGTGRGSSQGISSVSDRCTSYLHEPVCTAQEEMQPLDPFTKRAVMAGRCAQKSNDVHGERAVVWPAL